MVINQRGWDRGQGCTGRAQDVGVGWPRQSELEPDQWETIVLAWLGSAVSRFSFPASGMPGSHLVGPFARPPFHLLFYAT